MAKSISKSTHQYLIKFLICKLTTIFKTNRLRLNRKTANRRKPLAVKASNPEPKIELHDMSKNPKEKPPKCWFVYCSGPTSLSLNSSRKSFSRTNFKFSSTEKPEQIKSSLKKHKSIIVWKILQSGFTCFGFAKTISKRLSMKTTWENYYLNWGMSSAERKRIWLKVYKCAMSKVKKGKKKRNLSGWGPSSMASLLSFTSIHYLLANRKSLIFFLKSPAISWLTVSESQGTNLARKRKSSKLK